MPDKIFESMTKKVNVPCNHFYITVAYKDGKLNRTFVDGKNLSSCQRCLLQGISRLISLALQNGISKRKIIAELKGLRCNMATSILPRGYYPSCCHAFGVVLGAFPNEIKEGEKWEK